MVRVRRSIRDMTQGVIRKAREGNTLFGLKLIILAESAVLLLAASAQAAQATSVSLEGSVEVTSTVEGVDATTLLPPSDAKSAVESKLEAIAACADGVTQDVDGTYRVAIEVNGAGQVTAVRKIEGKVPEAVAACVEESLRGVSIAALSNPSAAVTLTATLKVKRVGAEPAVPAIGEPAIPTGELAEPATREPAPGTEAGKPEKSESDSKSVAGTGSAPQQAQATASAFGSVFGKADKTGESKPWRVFVDLTQSIGQGTFVTDDFARTASYGYLATIGASYKLTDMLSAGARISWAQNLTVTNRDTGTLPRELLFRDISLSASAPRVYHEAFTGIDVGAGISATLPTSKASRWTGRLFGLGARGSLSRTFEKVGPGDLSFGYALGVTKNFGPSNPSIDAAHSQSSVDACRSSNLADRGSCLSNVTTVNFSITNDLNVAYTFLEDFTFTVDFLIWNSVSHYLGDSAVPTDLTAARNVQVGRSQFASDRTAQSDLTVATIELAYSITNHISAAVGLYTAQNPFIQDGSNSRGLRFPFWDFRSTADNLSTIYLDLAFTY